MAEKRKRKKRERGRPSKLTPETTALVCKAIKLGVTYKDAAAYAGIAYGTFARWIAQGEEDAEGAYYDFNEAVKKADAEGTVHRLAGINLAGNAGNWQAFAWIQERRDPDNWGRRVAEVKHTGSVKMYKVVSPDDWDNE